MNTLLLTNTRIRAVILDNLSHVSCEFTFTNHNDFVVNPIHFFSLCSGATISNYIMRMNGKTIKGVVEEKKKAKQIYTDALNNNNKASIIEKILETDYKVSIANVESNQSIIVNFQYVSVLEMNNTNQYVFTFPTNMSIKYHSSDATKSDIEYKEEVNKITYVENIPNIYNFELKWITSGGFLSYYSNENVRIELLNEKTLMFSGKTTDNIVIYVSTNYEPTIYKYIDNETYIVSNIKIPDEIVNNAIKNYLFVIDRSGSMQSGKRMTKAKQALNAFVDNLPNNSYYNIISFGSNYEPMEPNTILVNDENRMSTKNKINEFEASMGGTELYKCLSYCLNVESKHETIIIVLTDGDIGAVNVIFELIKSKSINKRIFSIGVGDSVQKVLIKGMSDLTNGDYVTIDDNNNFETAINSILGTVNKQYYTNIRINDKPYCNAMYPNKVYNITIYDKHDINNLEIKAINPITNVETIWNIPCNNVVENFEYSVIKLLYYAKTIQNYEHSIQFDILTYEKRNTYINNIIQLSVENNLMNKYTSFVLVDYDTKTSDTGVDVVNSHKSQNDIVNDAVERIRCSTPLLSHSIGLNELKTNSSKIYRNSACSEEICSVEEIIRDSKELQQQSYVTKCSTGNRKRVTIASNNCEKLQQQSSIMTYSIKIKKEPSMFENFIDNIDNVINNGKKLLSINTRNKEINYDDLKFDGSVYRCPYNSYKLICYIRKQDFDADCAKCNLNNHDYFNMVILIDLMKNHPDHENINILLNSLKRIENYKDIVEKTYNTYLLSH